MNYHIFWGVAFLMVALAVVGLYTYAKLSGVVSFIGDLKILIFVPVGLIAGIRDIKRGLEIKRSNGIES